MLYEVLSRIQFGFTVGFHILWLSLSIGLSIFLFICELLWFKTKDKSYISIYMFWSKIFALSFAMGVVTGIPASFQLGTNFAKFSEFTSPILGPLLSVEILTAFFLEASFVGIMLFGWKKVPPLVHLLATGLVMLGTHNSTFWLSTVISWLHTPTGVEIIDGLLHPISWNEIIFNPSMPHRFTHILLSSYITTLFVILGTSATFIRRNKQNTLAKKSLTISLGILFFLVPLQAVSGHIHGLNTAKYQPAKVAAIKGQWETQGNAPFLLFAITNATEERNWFELKIPRLANTTLESTRMPTKGLKEWTKEERPSVGVVFWSYRIMLAIGLAMLIATLWGAYLVLCKKLYENKTYLKLLSIMTPAGFVAVLTGWCVSEIGRQPWSVYNLLKISQSHSPITSQAVMFSLICFTILYITLLLSYIKFAKYTYKKGMLPVEAIDIYHK